MPNAGLGTAGRRHFRTTLIEMSHDRLDALRVTVAVAGQRALADFILMFRYEVYPKRGTRVSPVAVLVPAG